MAFFLVDLIPSFRNIAVSELYGVGPGLLYTSPDVFGFDDAAQIGDGFG